MFCHQVAVAHRADLVTPHADVQHPPYDLVGHIRLGDPDCHIDHARPLACGRPWDVPMVVSSVASLVVLAVRAFYRLGCCDQACFYYLVAAEQTMDASEGP